MYWTGLIKSSRTPFILFAFLAVFILCFESTTEQVNAGNENATPQEPIIFDGVGVGPIPDGSTGCGIPSAQNLDITFDVNGIPNISNIEVELNITHTWMGDLTATLIAPSGESHVLFQNAGWTIDTSSCGYFGDFSGIYKFTDSSEALNLWSEAILLDDPDSLPSGDYRTTEPGGDSQTEPAPVTLMTPQFSDTETINGTWTLRINDGTQLDTGTVNGAKLIIDSAQSPDQQPAQNDFDGDGMSDYGTLRDETLSIQLNAQNKARVSRRSIKELRKDPGFKPKPAGNRNVNSLVPQEDLGWYVHNSATNTAIIHLFGDPFTDFYIPEDFDGDSIDDIAVWRGVADVGPQAGFFYVFQSSDNSINEIDFGVLNDNPTVVGDYDADGKADPAVYRCPQQPGQCFFYFRGSNNNPNGDITYVPFGNSLSGEIRPYPGDFDGDKKNDFVIFQDELFILFRSSDFGIEFIDWGLDDDILVPGDYDGDGKTDFMNVRVNASNNLEWWALYRTGDQRTDIWGVEGVPGFTEFLAPGDFDGDGITDLSVWRSDDSSNSNSFFWTLRSSDQQLQTFEWGSGLLLDIPIPGWNIQ